MTLYKRLIALIIVLALTINTSFATAFDFEGIQDEVYMNLTEYNSNFTINFYGSTKDLPDKINKIMNDALIFDDYLRYIINSWNIEYDYTQNMATIRVVVDYKTTKEKESFVRSEVTTILKDLNLEGLTDYQRLDKIIKYMNQNYSYDDTLKKFTAYDLITSKQAVCQGYGEMLYLLARGASIPVRTQEGTLKDTPHLWNLVKIGNAWYHVDATNFNLFKNEPYVVLPTESLLNYQYSWQNLMEIISDTINLVDVNYNSGLYTSDSISSNLMHKKSDYEFSETAKLHKTTLEKSIALSNLLKTEFENTKGIQTVTQYDTLNNAIKSLRETGYNMENIPLYSNQLITLSKNNMEKMTVFYSTLIKSSQKSIVNPPTESSLLKAIKILEDGKVMITNHTFDKTLRLNLVDSCNRKVTVHVEALIKLYKTLYTKTKKMTYKDKYLALSKKYNIKLN